MKSAAPLPTSHIKKNAAKDRPPKPTLPPTLTGSNVEVGTETADFNTSLLLRLKLDDDVLDVSTLSSLKYK